MTVVLDDAERFSLALGGARWLYHLLLAERYIERGFDRVDVDVDDIRADLDEWADEAVERAHLFDGWEPAAFWERVLDLNARFDPISRKFFDVWFDRMRTGDVRGIADDSNLRTTVEDRERFLKRGQARLSNDKLLAGWQGGAPGRVVFRWDQVSQLVDDVLQGLTDAGT